jgi:hypothetical protein
MSEAVGTRGDHCPSCERFIGPAGRCPYCGEDSAAHPFIRYLRLIALLLATGGLATLLLMAAHRDLPVQRVGDITPMMNFAYVRVVGTVIRSPYIADREGKVEYLSFLLDDGTGVIRVQAYETVARVLWDERRIPDPGMLVGVAGSLRVAAQGTRSLQLQSARQVELLTLKPASGIPDRPQVRASSPSRRRTT